MEKFGIDLSHHNAGINFDTLKSEGVAFAILRAGYTGYGNGVSKAKDTQFDNFYNQCKERGIGVGAYWFSCANTYQKGVDEANWMYENCLKGKQFDYPIYIDVEDDTGGKQWLRNAGKEKITDGIIGFCETLEKLGYYVGIYANLDWFNNWIDLDRVKDYDKWLAAWVKSKPKTFLSDTMWQFGGETNLQRSPILAEQVVDQDYCYTDYPSIIIEKGFNGYPKQDKPVEPPKPDVKPEQPKPKKEIALGDTVIVNGVGTASSTGIGAKTKNFVNQKMKVIMVAGNTSRPNRYALNQYDKGNVNDPRAVTGWFSINDIEK